MKQHHVSVFIKHSATIVFTALLSLIVIKADFEIFNIQLKTNEKSTITGCLLLFLIICGWYSVNVKLKHIQYKNSSKDKITEIGKLVKMLFYTGVFMNILLSLVAMKSLFGVIPDTPEAPVYVKLLFILLIIATLAVWFYELSIIQNKGKNQTYKKPRHPEVLSDILMMLYAGFSLVFVWKNLVISNISQMNFSMPIKDILSVILLGFAYIVICLPVQRVYYLEESLNKENNNTGKRIMLFHIGGVVVGALLPMITF